MSCRPPAPALNEQRRRSRHGIIGLDIHRAFAEAVAWDDGKLKRLGRVDMRRPLLEAFAKKLTKEDVVVVEATGDAASVAAVLALHVKKVVIVNPKRFASSLMRRSRPLRSTRKSSRSFMRAVFCRKSGFLTNRQDRLRRYPRWLHLRNRCALIARRRVYQAITESRVTTL